MSLRLLPKFIDNTVVRVKHGHCGNVSEFSSRLIDFFVVLQVNLLLVFDLWMRNLGKTEKKLTTKNRENRF